MLEMLVSCLDLRNFIDVFEGDGAIELVSWFSGALFDTGCLLDKVRGRGCFCDERKGTVRVDCNEGRNRDTGLYVCCPRVKLLAKVHRFYSTCTQCWANRGCGRCLPCLNQDTLEIFTRRVMF